MFDTEVSDVQLALLFSIDFRAPDMDSKIRTSVCNAAENDVEGDASQSDATGITVEWLGMAYAKVAALNCSNW